MVKPWGQSCIYKTFTTSNFSNGISNEQFSEDSPHDLTQENEALLARISRLQQENWVLEEKLSMLELSGGQMAEELVSKTKLIQQYCMDAGAKRAANRFPLKC